jgi:hypothetical protein
MIFILGVIAGAAIAYLLNKMFVEKAGNKGLRIGLKITSYILCIILGLAFTVFGSLRTMLNAFIDGRISYIEIKLNDAFPDKNLLNTGIDKKEFAPIVDELQKIVNNVGASGNNYFEKLVFDAIVNKLTNYVNMVENGVTTAIIPSDENGLITIKSVLYNLKDMVLKKISIYFILGQIAAIILVLVYTGILAGVIFFLKRGGALYNKSIVYGDVKDNDGNGNTQEN